MNISALGEKSVVLIKPYTQDIDRPQIEYLSVSGDDNYRTVANIRYELIAGTGEVVESGLFKIDGGFYELWKGDNEYPFAFVRDRINEAHPGRIEILQ